MNSVDKLKQRRDDRTKQIINYQLQIYQEKKEEIDTWYCQNYTTPKEQREQRYENNKEQLKEQRKQHYIENTVQECECNRKYRQSYFGKIVEARKKSKRRRELGYISLNNRFEGCHGHHINKLYVINIPAQMHTDNRHRLTDIESMNIINELAINFLNEQRS